MFSPEHAHGPQPYRAACTAAPDCSPPTLLTACSFCSRPSSLPGEPRLWLGATAERALAVLVCRPATPPPARSPPAGPLAERSRAPSSHAAPCPEPAEGGILASEGGKSHRRASRSPAGPFYQSGPSGPAALERAAAPQGAESGGAPTRTRHPGRETGPAPQPRAPNASSPGHTARTTSLPLPQLLRAIACISVKTDELLVLHISI